MPSINLTDVFDQNVPPDLQVALAGAIHAGHRTAKETIAGMGFDEHSSRTLVPLIRREIIERSICLIGPRFGKEVLTHVNRWSNAARILQCGGLLLTTSFLGENDGALPRPANYRSDLAREPEQSRLYPDDEQERLDELDRLGMHFAIVTHRGSWRAGRPSEIHVVFPDREYGLACSINLGVRMERRKPKQVEEIADQVMTELKPEVQREMAKFREAQGA